MNAVNYLSVVRLVYNVDNSKHDVMGVVRTLATAAGCLSRGHKSVCLKKIIKTKNICRKCCPVGRFQIVANLISEIVYGNL